MLTRESPAFEQIPTEILFDTCLTALDVRIYSMLCSYTKIKLIEKEAEERVCDLLALNISEYQNSLSRLESIGWIHTFVTDSNDLHITLYSEKRTEYLDIVYDSGDGF